MQLSDKKNGPDNVLSQRKMKWFKDHCLPSLCTTSIQNSKFNIQHSTFSSSSVHPCLPDTCIGVMVHPCLPDTCIGVMVHLWLNSELSSLWPAEISDKSSFPTRGLGTSAVCLFSIFHLQLLASASQNPATCSAHLRNYN